MTPCPTCGHHGSKYLTMRQLAARFADPDARAVTSATMRARGRRIAADLGLRIIVADCIEYVSEDAVDAAFRERAA